MSNAKEIKDTLKKVLERRCDHIEGTLTVDNLMPEQAIVETLGSGTLTAEREPGVLYMHGLPGTDYASVAAIEVDGQRFERVRECELVETDSYSNDGEIIHVLECSECGETCEHVNGSYPRCPHCGKAVKR